MSTFQLKMMILEKSRELSLKEEELIVLLDETVKLYKMILEQEKDVF